MIKPCLSCQKIRQAAQVVVSSKIIDGGTQSSRLAICQACPHLQRFHKGLPDGADIGLLDTCAECGCFIKAKTKLNTAFCPIGKWHETV